ncbi:MAG: lipid II flippase MurJ, partial [Syntrophomonadaceae bacterium]|nr:lipid II flippase MurJ [Syntrophomonadaceae bacterium]
GAFTHEASLMTSGALFYFALGALFFGVQEVLNKGFYALQDSRTPMYLAITSVLVNIGLSLALARSMGLNGLALANTLATAVLAVLLALMLRQRLRDMAAEAPAAVDGAAAGRPEPAGAATDREHSPAAFLLRLALAGAVTGLALWFSSALFFTRLALPGWAGLTLALGVSGLAYAAALAALGLVSPRKILARG